MKLIAFFSFLCIGSSSAFAPNAKSANGATSPGKTQLSVWTNEEMFDVRTGYNNYGYGMRGGPLARPAPGYRRGGMEYYGGAASTSTTRHPFGGKVEGGSRRTFNIAGTDSATVQLETDGRPLNAKVEVWQGPTNTPSKMKLYSEDGRVRPWIVGFANSPMGGTYESSMTVDNEGDLSFPIYVNTQDTYGMAYMGSSRMRPLTIDGNGAQKSFTIGPGPHVIEIWSESFPFFADVQVWEGPNNIKQSAEVYSDDGIQRPWTAIIDNTMGMGTTIQIRNVGPLEYPMRVCVEPLGGAGMGYGGGYGGYGGGYGGYGGGYGGYY